MDEARRPLERTKQATWGWYGGGGSVAFLVHSQKNNGHGEETFSVLVN